MTLLYAIPLFSIEDSHHNLRSPTYQNSKYLFFYSLQFELNYGRKNIMESIQLELISLSMVCRCQTE